MNDHSLPDPFEHGLISVSDVKNVWAELINKVQFLPQYRTDLIMEAIDDAKARLIDLAARNAQIFNAVRR